MTVAMLYARNRMIPPDCWNHDPDLKDKVDNETVAMMLARNGIIPPK